ncbi:MAG: Retroviral aspartyl protease [Chloroflexi bacterium]|nr:Retroviral aspartyl protease [Chloroflexota bacterium]
MGAFRKEIEIGGPDGSRYDSFIALVDTGASMSTLPASSLRELEVTPHNQLTIALADGRRIQRDVGQTWVRIDERAIITQIVFGDESVQPILGAYTLQGLMLAVETPNERLVRTEALLM